MNSLSMGKYRPAIILILALTVFLASCKGTSDDPKSWVVRTFAGTAGTPGSVDTDATADPPVKGGTFSSPQGVAVDKSGNVYVADTGNSTIRKITPGGDVSTFAGTALNGPQGIAVDLSGENLFVASTGDHTIRKVVISTGAVTIFAGTAGTATATAGTPTPDGTGDGTGTAATFNGPQGVAVDSNGIVYVADTGSHLIRRIASTGTRAVTTVGGTVNDNTAGFNTPQGLAVDSDGNVYVADTTGHRIRKITSAGEVTTIAGTATAGSADSVAAVGQTAAVPAQFNAPEGVAVDSSGNVYVVDTGNSTIRKITSTGVVTTFAGTAGTTGLADGPKATATFDHPAGVAMVGNNIYVADTANHIIRKIELK